MVAKVGFLMYSSIYLVDYGLIIDSYRVKWVTPNSVSCTPGIFNMHQSLIINLAAKRQLRSY